MNEGLRNGGPLELVKSIKAPQMVHLRKQNECYDQEPEGVIDKDSQTAQCCEKVAMFWWSSSTSLAHNSGSL